MSAVALGDLTEVMELFQTQFFHFDPHTIAILQAANQTDSTLLITGNTGTGKSHLAYVVHRASLRAPNRYFKVNLATLSENLIESELFGHERGAFTGADYRRIGRLEACNLGTVFLDEIGELSVRLQAKLLDFIQHKKITPVGSNREIELNVRIIAATNRNLEEAVRHGLFRADLYHRLNVFHVRIEDLALYPSAVAHFSNMFLEERSKTLKKQFIGLSQEVEHIFKQYPWPGNIRELENAIEFAVAMERSRVITFHSLPNHIKKFANENLKLESIPAPQLEIQSSSVMALSDQLPNCLATIEVPINMCFHQTRNQFEKTYLEQALRWCNGQINLTSRQIGLNKVSLTDKIRRHGINWKKIRFDSLTAKE